MRHGPHHHRHHHDHGRRGRLRRQLFFAFGVAILVTGGTVGVVMGILGGSFRGWQRELAGVERFVSGRFAVVWDDPRARASLTRALAHDLDLGVRVTDAAGRTLESVRTAPHCRHVLALRVPAQGALEGRVELCLDSHHPPPRRWVTVLALFLAGGVLWSFAGLWADRLARPLRELTRVAQDLGDGKLESRVRLRHGRRGEVGDLTHAINEMAGRIEGQIKKQRELLATVSHELRSPLARVRLLLELGREGKGGADVWSDLEGEVVEMDGLVGELLAGARLDFGALSPRPLDPREVAERALSRAGLSDAVLEVDGPPGSLTADATLLARALGALLDNARKHGGGRVVLRLKASADRVAFEVDDQGPGFAPEDTAHVFEPFYRGQGRARDEARGVGLGLAIVRRIAEAHGGRAYADSPVAGGARVGIDLPRVPPGGGTLA